MTERKSGSRSGNGTPNDLPINEEELNAVLAERAEEDFLAFVRSLVIPSAVGPVMMEDAMLRYEDRGVEPFQRAFFEDMAPTLHAIQRGDLPAVRRFWLERTKKASKDSDLAVCVLWLMTFVRRPVFCQIVAADKDQAGIIQHRASDILFYNEWLKKYVRVVTNKIVSVNGLGKCVIEATDKASAHGETPDLLILNELVHVAKWEVMETHYNNASGVPRGVMVISTNAGYKGTKAEKWKQTAEKKPRRWHMHLWKKESPWLNDEDIEDARSINLPSEFARLFQGRWPSGKGEGITEEAIDNVFRSYLEPMTGNEEGWEFVAGLDMARTHDHAGLTVLGANKEEKRIRVAYLRDWKPNRPNSRGVLQIDSEAVKRTIVEVYKQFGITWFGYDPSEGAYMMEQELAVLGVGMVEVPFTGASLTEMVTALMKALPHLESYESEVLRRDLGKFTLVRKQPKGYRMKAVSDEYGHADVGTALLICLPQAVEIVGGLVPVVSENFFYSIEDEKDAEVEKARQADSFLDELLGGGIDNEDGDFRLDGHLLDM